MSHVRKDVLNGWKEIAAYLGRDPRTVERWEKQRQLPVRRVPGGGRASVYALIAELDAWLARPSAEMDPPRDATPSAEAGHASVAEPAAGTHTGLGSASSPEGEVQAPAAGGRSGATPWIAGLLAAVALAVVASLVVRSRSARPPLANAVAGLDRVRTLAPTSRVPGVEDLYLRGCYDAELRTPEALQRAEASFSSAIAKDPTYAPAYSGLASTFLLLREYSLLSEPEAYDRALRAADEALRLDPEFPQAHAVKGFVDFFWKWNGASAAREFESAERLEPTLPLAHHWYGSMLTHEGRFREALEELQIAQKLEPSSVPILTMRAYALGLSGHRAEAEDLLREAILTERPGVFRWPSTMHHVLAVLSLQAPRDVPRFLSESLIAAELRNDEETVRALRRATEVYRAGGETAMWRCLLEQEQRKHGDGSATYEAARYKAVLGQRDEALRDLRALYTRHDPALIGVTIDPLFAELHGDSRFLNLRHSLGFPDEP